MDKMKRLCWVAVSLWVQLGNSSPASAQTLPVPMPSGPPNGATGQSPNVTLTWGESFGASDYRVQVSLSPSFSTLVLDSSGINNTVAVVGGLAQGTTFYWRVRGYTFLLQSDWSATWTFTTRINPPQAPTLSSPLDGAMNQPTSPMLMWAGSPPGAQTYHVQVSTSALFTSMIVDDSSIAGTGYQVGPLASSTLHYWRLRARNAGGISPWSSVWRFTTVGTIPGPVALNLPANGSINQPLTLTLSWNASPGAQAYHVQVSLTAGFASTLLDDSAITATSRQVAALAPGTLHYWRVRGRNSGGAGAWSAAWRFTTISAPPPAPTLGSPINGATNQPTTLSLSWNGVTGATHYHVQVSPSSSFSTHTVNDSLVAGTTRQVGQLSASLRYYWRVRGVNTGGSGAWSPTWNFLTASALPPPLVPALSSPLNGVSNQPATLRLTWRVAQRATAYHLQVSTSPTYAVAVIDSPGIIDTSFQIGPLADSTTYYWHARATNDSGPSNWSPSSNFTTRPAQPGSLDAPELVAPPNGATGQPTTLLLQWNEVVGATSYRVQVSTDASFSSNIVDRAGLTSTSHTASGLSPNTSYYWRVQSSTLVLTSGWSSVWTFSTLGGTPPPPALASPPNNAVQSTTSVQLTWGVAAGASSYHVQLGRSSTFATPLVNDSATTGSSYDVVGLDTGATYYWRVRARGTAGWGAFSPVWSFSTYSTTTSTVTLNWTTDFPQLSNATDYGPADYRIVGLPGASDSPLQSFLTGSSGSEWQAYWDNGAAGGYLIPFNGDTTFRCLQGRAFWLVRKGPWVVNASVRAAQLDSSHQAQIVLHPGWNLITNPFTTSIPWSAVQQSNGLADPIYEFDGSFSTSTNFDPYVGYYFFNSGGRSILCIPTSGDRMANPHPPTVSATVQGSAGWQVNAQLAAGNHVDASTWFGVAPGAEDGMDYRDFRKPRAVGTLPAVYFRRPGWDSVYSDFATDIRPEHNSLNEWQLTVKAPLGAAASMTFNGIGKLPVDLKVYIVDDERMVFADLRGDSTYKFTPMTGSSIFRVVVGNEQRISALLRALRTPESFVLEGNFPNPFNPSTIISLLVPNTETFELKIYDALGREVRALFAGNLSAGRHFVEWDGMDDRGVHVASGMYFCRMMGQDGLHGVRKMMLMK